MFNFLINCFLLQFFIISFPIGIMSMKGTPTKNIDTAPMAFPGSPRSNSAGSSGMASNSVNFTRNVPFPVFQAYGDNRFSHVLKASQRSHGNSMPVNEVQQAFQMCAQINDFAGLIKNTKEQLEQIDFNNAEYKQTTRKTIIHHIFGLDKDAEVPVGKENLLNLRNLRAEKMTKGIENIQKLHPNHHKQFKECVESANKIMDDTLDILQKGDFSQGLVNARGEPNENGV